MVAGISFSMFTLPQVLQYGTIIPIAVLTIRLAITAAAFAVLNLLVTGYGDWPSFVFVGNWISPYIEGAPWFIDVYMQLLCVMMLLLAIPQVRHQIQTQTFHVMAASAATMVVVAAVADSLIDTHHLLRRLPHLLAWFFLIGAAAAYARTETEKAILTVILLLGNWQFVDFQAFVLTFFPLAPLAMIWMSSIKLPRFLANGFRMIAGASLIIYLTHFQFASLAQKLVSDHSAVGWATAIVGGVIIWRIYDRIDIWLAFHIRNLLSRNRDRASLN